MIYKKIIKCRNCKSDKLRSILNLGFHSLTGKFIKFSNKKVAETPLELSICKNCNLVQLSYSIKNSFLYNLDYGYESGINMTMKNHLAGAVKEINNIINLNSKSIVMDIASNDGTLLNSYDKDLIKIGIDPILKRFKQNYKNINFKISNFFSNKAVKNLNLKKNADVITAFSVFYDLENPNLFLKDIKKNLNKNGIFIMEQSNLAYMIKLNSFDTICQEHSCYYSTRVIKKMLEQNNLKLFDHKYNNTNGGSSRYYVAHLNNIKIKVNNKNITKALKFEEKYKLEKLSTYKKFKEKVENIRKINLKKINNILSSKKSIHGYGASTKGNVILQYFNLDNKCIKFIADRNPFKYNKYTPGTNIKIISEKKSRKMKPDYYFVLPWHFKKEILKREISIRKDGTKFIFPLPKLKIF